MSPYSTGKLLSGINECERLRLSSQPSHHLWRRWGVRLRWVTYVGLILATACALWVEV